jgi:pimeloyl-ACP methyl ester carboxylesterase
LRARIACGTVFVVGVGGFRSDAARDAYLAAYDQAMAAWPATPAHQEIEHRFGTTYVQSLGPRTGSPIVLLHAIAVSSPMWYRAVRALAEHHPVYAIDTVTDVGRSVQRASIDHSSDMAVWLDDVLERLELSQVHVVGLSYGGWIALNQAQRAPQRLASVTAIDPPMALGSAQIRSMLSMIPDALRAKYGKSDAALHRMLARLNNGVLPEEPVLSLATSGLRTFKSRTPRPERLSDDDLRSITTPTLLLLGAASPVNHAPRAAQRARDLMPDVTVDIVEGGHMVPVDNSDDFTNRVLAFVDGVDDPKHAPGETPTSLA